jgi:hypothetical protein
VSEPLPERLLTAREVARLLSFQAGTIVDWTERDEIPAFTAAVRDSEVVEALKGRRTAAGGVRRVQRVRPAGSRNKL